MPGKTFPWLSSAWASLQPWIKKITVAAGGVILAGAVTGAYRAGAWVIHSLTVIETQVADIRAAMAGGYTAREAAAAHALIWRTDRDQYRRIENLRGELYDFELSMGRHTPESDAGG